LLGAIAEEGKRNVERLLRDRPEIVPARDQVVAPSGESGADVSRQVERHEEPHARRAEALLRQTGSSSPRSSRRSMCIATVVARSRISARSPGSRTSRAIAGPSASFTDQQT
jgi:hypothetical protein